MPKPTGFLCPVPQPTRNNEATCWPHPRKMGQADPTRRMHSHISDGEVCGLTLHRVLWYFAVQSKRPFKIPIPHLSHPKAGKFKNTLHDWRSGSHRTPGLFAIRGPGITPQRLKDPVPAINMAPTICSWFDISLKDIDGEIIPELDRKVESV